MPVKMDVDRLLSGLRAMAESSRLRILSLLAQGELTVKDLTEILGQSQPRISRHLKLLADAGLVRRYPEGAWVYYRLADHGAAGRLVAALLAQIDPDDPVVWRDNERLKLVKQAHAERAGAYFAANAEQWDEIRALHVAESAVEAEMRRLIGETPFQRMLDLGTGTGRLLEVFADLYVEAVGIDNSPAMLNVARANLDRAGISHAQVRHGDILATSSDQKYDLITVHQVLHFMDQPAAAIQFAASQLTPGGRLLIVDFAPHGAESLRETHAHRRLGFAKLQMQTWIEDANLALRASSDLAPAAAGEQLTVSLWLAQEPTLQIAASGKLNVRGDVV